jgi:hypothetical protein
LAVLPYAIAFAAAYRIREFISRRRCAAWLDRNRQRQEEVKKLPELPDDLLGNACDASAADTPRGLVGFGDPGKDKVNFRRTKAKFRDDDHCGRLRPI